MRVKRTALLIGPFGLGDSLPLSIEIAGQLEDIEKFIARPEVREGDSPLTEM